MISIHFEISLGQLRYNFEVVPPQPNCQLELCSITEKYFKFYEKPNKLFHNIVSRMLTLVVVLHF